MIVETYEVNETDSAGETEKMDAETCALIESLALKGRQELIHTKASGQRSVIPYNEMTAGEKSVYTLLFPEHTDVFAYSAGPIPIRVLPVIAFAKPLFEIIQVWHLRTGSAKDDPVLIGFKPHVYGKAYLLARWGDALRPFAELVKMAAVLARDNLRVAFAKAKSEADQDLASVESVSDSYAVEWATRNPVYHSSRPRT